MIRRSVLGGLAIVTLSQFAIIAYGEPQPLPAPRAPIAGPRPIAIAPAQKDVVFKSPAYWEQQQAARLRTAPQAIQDRIAAQNAALRQKGKRAVLGYTSVYNEDLAKITGLTRILDPSRLPPAPAPQPSPPSCLETNASPSASMVDMRDYGIVTRVHWQGGCGSCWAFATAAALETSILLKNGPSPGADASSLSLSAEQILSCTGNAVISGNNCGGGMTPFAAGYVMAHSIVTWSAWPYTNMQESASCQQHQNEASRYRASQWGWVCPGAPVCVMPSQADIKRAIVTHGSVISSMVATQDFQRLSGGVYDLNDGAYAGAVPEVNHVVQIVGWDDGRGAWLIKNSWDTGWGGEGGFGWLAYGNNGIGAYAIWLDAQKYANSCGGTLSPLGTACSTDAACMSNRCDAAAGSPRRCIPMDGSGNLDDYCTHTNQCANKNCLLNTTHTCAAPTGLGQDCQWNEGCTSGRCDNAPGNPHRCIPADGWGNVGDYCTHTNQCKNKNCLINTTHTCASVAGLGGDCQWNEGCASGRCDVAPGNPHRCIPPDGWGNVGDYCTHTNQCKNKNCRIDTTHICEAPVANGGNCHWNEGCVSGRCDPHSWRCY